MRVLGAAAVVATVLLIGWSSAPIAQWSAMLLAVLRDSGATGVAAYVAAYALAVVLFAPATVFTVAAGAAFGPWGIVPALAGAWLGSAVAFGLARAQLRGPCAFLCAQRARLDLIDRALAGLGWRAVLLIRLSPIVPFSLQNYLFGLSAVSARAFLAAGLAGMLPSTLVKVSLGATLADPAATLVGSGGETAALVVAVVASVIAPWMIARRYRHLLGAAGPALSRAGRE